MNDILQKITQAPSLPMLWRQMARYYDTSGFAGMSYHWMLPGTNVPTALPFQYGFTQVEQDYYVALDFQRLDIVPRVTLAAGRATRWSEVWNKTELTFEERQFVAAIRAINFSDGYSFPCYGPGNRNGVVALGKMKPDADLSGQKLMMHHFAAQGAHLRVCQMFADGQGPERQLSSREKEILHWVAQGKSNNVIAAILEISAGTVDTYMRRIYEKLDVSDRTSAAVKGVGLGLVAI